MLTNSSRQRAGARGGGMGERPRWVRIFLITGGSLMEEIIFILPPQFVHFDTSTPNTRARIFAQELFLREAFSFGSLFSCFSFSLIWALVSPGIITDLIFALRAKKQVTQEQVEKFNSYRAERDLSEVHILRAD